LILLHINGRTGPYGGEPGAQSLPSTPAAETRRLLEGVFVKKLALVGLAGVVAAMGIAAPSVAGGNKYAATETIRDCGDGDTVTLDGPLKLWPPNHKFVDEPVTATDGTSAKPTDGASNATTLTITPEVADAVGGDGGSAHDPDWQLADGTTGDSFMASGDPSATAELQFRAERSGKGEGRAYTITWAATFDGGSKKCSSSDSGQSPFTVEVPHDMGGGADWKN
jgi:hypothetical protein